MHDMLDEIRRPRYLKVLTTSTTVSLSIIGFMGDNRDLLRETCMTLHFDRLKDMKLEVAQVSIWLTLL